MANSEYTANVLWHRKPDEIYVDRKYSRAHQWEFDGGVTVPASPSPHVVPSPYSDENAVDPEEAFVASLSSCHMLFFLDFAAKNAYVVDRYVDKAVGILSKNADGKMAMTKVTLRPNTRFSGENQPTIEQIQALHHQAHAACFIANSVNTDLVVEISSND